MKAKLQVTTNYDLFEMHEFNRPLHHDSRLEESMKEHGFMPSCAIHVISNGQGKYRIVRGHHRFHYAKRLNLPIWFILDETDADIFYLEGDKQRWSVMDFAEARANAGDENCEKLLFFKRKHNLPIGAAASLVGGQSAGSGNKIKQVKAGTFKVADMNHANKVAFIIDGCREAGLEFATNSKFIAAISSALRISEFDSNMFLHKIKLFNSNIRKRTSRDEYLDEIEALYNYGTQKGRIAIAFKAKEIARERALTFGGKINLKK